jgi:hypothetical protein
MFTKTKREIGEYVGRTYPHDGTTIRQALESLMISTRRPPPDYDEASASEIEKIKWKMEYDSYIKKKD